MPYLSVPAPGVRALARLPDVVAWISGARTPFYDTDWWLKATPTRGPWSERVLMNVQDLLTIGAKHVTNLAAEEIYSLGHGGLCLNCPTCVFPNCSFGR